MVVIVSTSDYVVPQVKGARHLAQQRSATGRSGRLPSIDGGPQEVLRNADEVLWNERLRRTKAEDDGMSHLSLFFAALSQRVARLRCSLEDHWGTVQLLSLRSGQRHQREIRPTHSGNPTIVT